MSCTRGKAEGARCYVESDPVPVGLRRTWRPLSRRRSRSCYAPRPGKAVGKREHEGGMATKQPDPLEAAAHDPLE